jgi:hypothetical protein
MQQKLMILFFVLLTFAFGSSAQQTDSTKSQFYFSGAFSITNNGISIVPSFSLEKPAAIVNLTMGKKKLTFEPDLRFSLAGRPWSFLFWARYKILTGNKIQLNAGTHLGLNFKTSRVTINGETSKQSITRRYLAGELFPSVFLTRNISVGIYYLYSHGLDPGTINNTHFITLNTNFSHIKLSDQFFLKFNPQFYFLKLDKEDGFYFTSALTVARHNFPFSVSGVINKKINSDITGSKNLLWNASLVYSFSRTYD